MANARTYADIVKAAPTPLRPWVAERFPDGGVFGVTANILGVITNYFLTGPVGSPAAFIIGRVEMLPGGRQDRYVGSRLKGGTLVTDEDFDLEIGQYNTAAVA